MADWTEIAPMGSQGNAGNIFLNDGTAAGPSVYFTLDTNTGVFNEAADTVSIAAAGVEIIRTTGGSQQFLETNGTVTLQDVGTTAIGTTITSKAGKSAYLGLNETGGNGWVFAVATGDSSLYFATGMVASQSTAFKVGSNGQVRALDGTVTAPIFTFDSDLNVGVYHPNPQTLDFATNGTGVMSIDSSGNVCFGVPSAFGANAQGCIGLTAGTVPTTSPTVGMIQLYASGGWLYGRTDASEILTLSPPQGRILNRAVKYACSNFGAITGTTNGFSATISNLGSAFTNGDDSSGNWLVASTTNVSGNANGFAGLGTNWSSMRRDWEPEWMARIQTGADITSVRLWQGLFSATPQASATPAIHIAAFRYDTGVDGTAFWRCVTDNGSGSPTVTITTSPIAVSTNYRLRIVCNNTTPDVKFFINDTLVATHTTTLPTSSQSIGPGNVITTLTTAIKTLKWGRTSVTHD